MKTRNRSSVVLGLLLLALFCSACVPTSPTPTPLAGLVDLQTAPGLLNVTLQDEEAETFAGLWIENEPELRVIALFTQDGEKTVQPYIAGSVLEGRVEVRQARYTLAELTSTEHDLYQIIRSQALPFSTAVDIQENRVIVYVTDQVLWEHAIQENGLALPEYVASEVIYEPLRGQPDFPVTPVPDLFFPQLRARSATFMAALLEGQLTLENGCLRVVTSYSPESNLIIWQPDYFPTLKEGRVEILDRDGQVVARVGEPIALGGGGIQLSDDYSRQLREPIPAACEGPYFLMGEVVSQPLLTPAPVQTLTPAFATATPVPTLTLEPTALATAFSTATPVPTRTATPAATGTAAACSVAPDTELKIGDWAHVSVEQPFSNRIRSTPSLSAEMIGSIQPGEIVKVLDGPSCADGYIWWLVRSLAGLEGWTAEGDDVGDWIVAPQDTFFYDTVAQDSTSRVTLKPGQKYRIILAGTYSLWIPGQWTDQGVCIWGESDPKPMILSPAKINGQVGADPFVVFARPFYRNDCTNKNLVPENERISQIMISLDGGSNYSILTPLDAAYRQNHTYLYTVTGKGYPLKIRLADPVLEDNYGQITVMIEEIHP